MVVIVIRNIFVLQTKTMTTIPPFAQSLLDEQSILEGKLSQMEGVINKAPRQSNGLTLDADRTPEWRNAKKMYSIYWDAYRRVNKQLSKVRKAIGYEAINGKRVAIYQYL